MLVSPAFHGYWRSIARSWEELGYEVTTLRYDAFDSAAEKARNKLLFELPAQMRVGRDAARSAASAFATRRALAAVEQVRPDMTLVVKGDLLEDPFWDALDRVGSKKLLWLYDERRRTTWDQHRLSATGASIASYSRQDVRSLTEEGLRAFFLPLAYDADRPYLPVPSPDIIFVGARYPNRQAALSTLVGHGVPVRAFGRDWSHRVTDRLRTWQWSRPAIPAAGDVPLDEAYGRMAGAVATLNIHGDQDGFTMRTFEASGVGGVQLVDRADVSEFYEPGREVAVFEGPEDLTELAQRAVADAAWGRGLRSAGRRRTLAEHTFLHRARVADSWWS